MLFLITQCYCKLNNLIGGSKGGREGCAPPLGVQILSISCSFSVNLAISYVGAPPGELAPPPRGNPGSATEPVIVTSV